MTFDAAAIAQTSATLNALGPHPFGSPRNKAAAQFVAAKLEEAGLSQTTVVEFTDGGSAGANVVSSLAGRGSRLLIIATHHDSRKDAVDVSDRSRSLSLLIEIARHASRLRPARTWILASFDGGESKGEGFTNYLESLGKSRELIDGVVIIDASPLAAAKDPALIAPSCPGEPPSFRRALAGRDLVAAAVSGLPGSLDVSFDDPGISLLTQPFIRAFRTDCEPLTARAAGAALGVIKLADRSFSRGLVVRSPATPAGDPAMRDDGAARLGEAAFGAVQGIDAATWPPPQSDSWLVLGRSVLPGWLIFSAGALSLVPGLLALRSGGTKLALRALSSAIFLTTLYHEPEIALFAGALPYLLPSSAPRKFFALALIPFGFLISAGALGFVRGQVTGTWLSIWIWAGLLLSIALVVALPGGGRKAPARARRGKK